MKKEFNGVNVRTWVFIFVSLSIFLLFTYYLFYLFPKKVQFDSLIRADRVLQQRRSLLTENISLMTQYSGLDPTLPTFPADRENIKTGIADSVGKISDEFSSETDIRQHFFLSGEVKDHLVKINESNGKYSEKVSEILKTQKNLGEELERFNKSAGKIYGYDPQTEFSQYVFPESREDVLEAVAVISAGIKKVGEQTMMLGIDNAEYNAFDTQLQVVLGSLERLGNLVEGYAEINEIERQIKEFADGYRDLKMDTFALELRIFKSDEALSMFAGERDVIAGYAGLISETSKLRLDVAGKGERYKDIRI